MPKHIQKNRRLTAEEISQLRVVREEFAMRPSKSKLLKSRKYVGPMSIQEYLSRRKETGDQSDGRVEKND